MREMRSCQPSFSSSIAAHRIPSPSGILASSREKMRIRSAFRVGFSSLNVQKPMRAYRMPGVLSFSVKNSN